MRKTALGFVAAAVMVPALAGAAWADYVYIDTDGVGASQVGSWDATTKTLTLTHDVTDSLVVLGSGITIDGAGHRIAGEGPENGDWVGIWIPQGVTGTRVRHCTIERFNEGVYLVGQNHDTVVEDNVFSASAYAGVLQYGSSESPSRNVSIARNRFVSNGQSLMIACLEDSAIAENVIADGPLLVSGATRIAVRDNEVTGGTPSEFTYWGMVQLRDLRDSVVEDNRLRDCEAGGIVIWGATGEGIVAGNTVVLNRVERCWQGLAVTGSGNTITDNVVTDLQQPGPYGFGITAGSGIGNHIERNTVTRANSIGIYALWLDDSFVRDNDVVDCGTGIYGSGIYATGDGVAVEDNRVSGGGSYFGICIDGDGAACRRNTVRGFTGNAIGAWDGPNLVVELNEVVDCTIGYWGGFYGTGMTFSDNTADACGGGMYLGRGATAAGNRILRTHGIGILTADVSGNTIVRNTIADSDGTGIYGGGDLIEGNTILRSGRSTAGHGFGLYTRGRGLTIQGNRIEESRQGAMYLEGGDAITITGNVFANNGNETLGAVCIEGGSTNVVFERNTLGGNVGPALAVRGTTIQVLGNTITDTVGHGIRLVDGRDHTVAHNVVTGGSGAGIRLDVPEGCRIYDNRFDSASTIEAYPYAPANTWSVAKTAGPNVVGGPWIGGNFWGNAAGTGWSQVTGDADGDGFCDAPFTIAPGNVDLLPLAENVPPTVNATGAGVYELGSTVNLGGTVADRDGDLLTWTWRRADGSVLASGSLRAPTGGAPVALPAQTIATASLGVGMHTFTVEVSDGHIQDPVAGEVLVEVKDTKKPVLAPTANVGMLWPPNHQMVAVTIDANASDEDGIPSVTATATSNEPDDGLGDGDTANDVQSLSVDPATGRVTVQLRAERSGRGTGRVYTVTLTATDRSGNVSMAAVTIVVPRSQAKGGN